MSVVDYRVCVVVLLWGLLLGSSLRADDNASVLMEVSSTQTTPGQQLNVTLSIYYDDGIRVQFKPTQHSWKPFQLLTYGQSPPAWVQGQWQVIYQLQLAAPAPGHYQYPELVVHFYRGEDHWQMTAEGSELVVLSAFEGQEPRLQGLEALPLPPRISDYLLWLCISAFLLLLAGLWLFRKQDMVGDEMAAVSAMDLARQADETGYMDWEALRHWLIKASGSDPLGKLSAPEPLLHQYQRLRFDHSCSSDTFSELCHQCQERWP